MRFAKRMAGWAWRISLAAGVLALWTAAAGNGTETLVRTHEGGGVAIDVRLEPPEKTSDGLRFLVRMNTHSAPLDGYDLMGLSVLRDGRGRTLKPEAWDNPEGAGHHRSGVLAFPAKTPGGAPVPDAGAEYLELVIRDVAGVPERVFRWDLPLKPNAR